ARREAGAREADEDGREADEDGREAGEDGHEARGEEVREQARQEVGEEVWQEAGAPPLMIALGRRASFPSGSPRQRIGRPDRAMVVGLLIGACGDGGKAVHDAGPPTATARRSTRA